MSTLRGYLVCVFKQSFSVFKQYFTHFYIFFHLPVFSQIFSNNNFQFLITCTKQNLNISNYTYMPFTKLKCLPCITPCTKDNILRHTTDHVLHNTRYNTFVYQILRPQRRDKKIPPKKKDPSFD